MKFSGERYIPTMTNFDIGYEHLHRYYYAQNFINNESKVLDIGCGVGYGSELLSNKGGKVIGIDIDKDSIEYARKNHCNNKTEYFVLCVNSLNTITEKFHLITCFETLEHVSLENQKDLLKFSQNLLNPDGLFLISTPNKQNYIDNNPFHLYEHSEESFVKLISKYFEHFILLKQNIYVSSLISDHQNKRQLTEIKVSINNNGIYSRTDDPSLDTFLIAICSNKPLLNREFYSSLLYDPNKLKKNLFDDNQISYYRDSLRAYKEELEKREALQKNYSVAKELEIKELKTAIMLMQDKHNDEINKLYAKINILKTEISTLNNTK